MTEKQSKRVFRNSGVANASGYGIRRFMAQLSSRLTGEHKGHKVQALLYARSGNSLYRCSCGKTIGVKYRDE